MDNKTAYVVIIISFLLGTTVGFIIAGSNENIDITNTPEFKKFIGTWTAVEQHNESDKIAEYTWIFYKNHSVYLHIHTYNETDSFNLTRWYIFEIFEGELKLTRENVKPYFYQYEFSDDRKQLTLINRNGMPLVLTKVE